MLQPLTGYNNINQISLTGVRAIIMMGLLIIAPSSFEDIKKVLVEKGISETDISDDVLRIDLNTIKTAGCEISRASKKTDHKYILTKHPLSLPVTIDDYKIVKRVYDKIKDNLTLNELLGYDELLKKIASFIFDEELYEKFMGISVLKQYNRELIQELISDCENENTLELIYKTISAGRISLKKIAAKKLVFKNDKLYLYGYDFQKKANVTLNIQRISSVNSRKLVQYANLEKTFNVKFLLKNYEMYSQTEEENILKTEDDEHTIEGRYFNEFTAIQRILSFGSNCKVLEPAEFRDKIIAKLKSMSNIYDK